MMKNPIYRSGTKFVMKLQKGVAVNAMVPFEKVILMGTSDGLYVVGRKEDVIRFRKGFQMGMASG